MGRKRARDREGIYEPNMTPVIDVSLVLVVILLVATPMALQSAAVLTTVGCAVWSVREFYEETIVASRSFYGVLRVKKLGHSEANYRRSLIHGTILHGNQYLDPVLSRQASTYYTETSGIGRLLDVLNPRKEPLRVGVIGLGTGSLAAWGAKGDVFRFYEINPDVIAAAKSEFTYLGDSDATVETALGDARLVLEREAPQRFDVLAIDAFSSDSIPVHLITAEALAIYRRHVKADGMIAFHVTNRFLNLIPVVDALARAQGLTATHIADGGEGALASRSDWVLVSANKELLEHPRLAGATEPIQSAPIPDMHDIDVTINAEGKIFLDSRPVEMPVLEAELKRLAQAAHPPQVLIQADHSLPYGT